MTSSSLGLDYLPHDYEAEEFVLGACLISPDAIFKVLTSLRPDDFFNVNHQALFETMTKLYSSGSPVDHVTVADDLLHKNLLDRLGGPQFLINLAGLVSSTANVDYYAAIVREKAIRRKLILAGQSIIKLASDYRTTNSSILEEAEKLVFNAGMNSTSNDFIHLRELVPNVLNSIENTAKSGPMSARYPTGLIDLDRILLGGLEPGSLNIIAARPSMGKTALAMNIAQFGGNSPKAPVLIFSLEMPASQLVKRMIAAHSGITLTALTTGALTANDFSALKETCSLLAQSEIYINDTPQLSSIDMRARCRRFKMRHPELSVIVVDYLQLMTSGNDQFMYNRTQEVSDISRGLKAVAREMNCPVIALSQLSREAEKRADKKPQLADLRDSGAIEQDADVVMLLFRQDYYSEHENNDLKDSDADLRVAKNRNGATGTCKLTFRREVTRFLNQG